MTLDQKKIDQLLNYVKGRYRDWRDFSNPQFIEEEINYKQQAISSAQELLSNEILQQYLNEENSEDFIKALERVARSTNLLFLGAPRTGDLSILYVEELDKLSLCRAIYDLFYGKGAVNERLGRYLSFVDQNKISFKWTFPTYFLYLLFPETEIIIKPETTRWFLNFVGSEVKYSNQTDINIYTTFRAYAQELRDSLAHLKPHSMLDIQSIMYISVKIATGQEGGIVPVSKRREFKRLFDEFIQDYPITQPGNDHITFYRFGRQAAEKNFDLLMEKRSNGEDITDDVLLKLLPYSDSPNNKTQGAWIHIAPAITGNIKSWFENVGWQKAENWPQVADLIFSFVLKCVNDPSSVEESCRDFSHSPLSTGLQTGMLTPILNALRPDDFILINNKSRDLYNYFTDSDYSQKLIDYPSINTTAKQMIVEISEDISSSENLPDLAYYDLLDMFSHWLKAIKKFEFKGLDELAKPFSLMFLGRDEADMAFNWLAETCANLGIKNPDNPKAAFTLRYRQGYHRIHMSYGRWLILGFSGRNGSLAEISMALFQGDYGIESTYEGIFTQDESEQPVRLYSFLVDQFFKHENELRLAFSETVEFIAQRFENWQSSPYHTYTVSELAQAIFDLDVRDKVLQEGLHTEEIDLGDDLEGTIRYWKVSPGEQAWNWKNNRDGGYIALGWDEIGDLSGIDRQTFEEKRNYLTAKHDDWTETGVEQLWKFIHINEGDKVVANRGTTRVLGIGTVTGGYYFIPNEEHGHRLPVDWFDLQEREVNEGGWRRTIVELEKDKFDQIQSTKISEPGADYTVIDSDRYINSETFSLLDDLNSNPFKDYYLENKIRFQKFLFDPFKSLITQIASQLPILAKEVLETEKRLFSQIYKNDYGKGGAYDFFWGAFYPKGTSRSGAPQLSFWINKDRLEFGFYIGIYGKEFRERFIRNCRENYERLVTILEDSLTDGDFIFGTEDVYKVSPNGEIFISDEMTWDNFLQNPESADFNVTRVIPRVDVLRYKNEQIIDICLDTYSRVFPLVLLAISDDPLPLINEYLEIEFKPELEINEIYTISDCARDTYMDEEQLARWISAIQRKGQSILYGPPGTGKTYVAEHLAKHFIGGGDGFKEVVQFHPSYAYEDFMQGIRPQTAEDGKSLSYPLVPGRFVEFCKRARLREGKCVLVIDEINRANLSRVFGELMYLLEYRDREIPLSGGGAFRIPTNVLIIGTMNTADRSIALVDHALRRRFAFIELGPNYNILRKFYEDKPFNPEGLINILERLNNEIDDKHYEVGISFFLVKDANITDFIEDIWRMEVEPYLEEYFFAKPDKVKEFRWNKLENEILR